MEAIRFTMPPTRGRTRATGEVADLGTFLGWAETEIKRRVISTKEFQQKLDKTIEEAGGHDNLQEASLDELREWINGLPLKAKNKNKGKNIAPQPAEGTPPQANAETTGAPERQGGKLRKAVVPKPEPTDENRSTGAARGGLLKSLFAPSQPAVPVEAAPDPGVAFQDGPDSSDEEENETDSVDKMIRYQGQKQQEPLVQEMDAEAPDILGLLAQVKGRLLEADMLDLSPKEIKKLESLKKQLEKAKASKTGKKVGGKSASKPLLETSRRIATKTKPKGGPTTKDTQAWADTRGYHARSPREQPAAVKATSREIPDIDYDEMDLDTEYDETRAESRAGAVRARSTASPASAEAMDEDEDEDEEEGEVEEEEEEDQEDKGGGGRRRAAEAAPKFPQKNTDIAQLLEDHPLEIPKQIVLSATPGQFQYHDHVTGTSVDATIHCVVPRGGLLVSLPSRNPDYPGLRAGATTKDSESQEGKEGEGVMRGFGRSG